MHIVEEGSGEMVFTEVNRRTAVRRTLSKSNKGGVHEHNPYRVLEDMVEVQSTGTSVSMGQGATLRPFSDG